MVAFSRHPSPGHRHSQGAMKIQTSAQVGCKLYFFACPLCSRQESPEERERGTQSTTMKRLLQSCCDVRSYYSMVRNGTARIILSKKVRLFQTQPSRRGELLQNPFQQLKYRMFVKQLSRTKFGFRHIMCLLFNTEKTDMSSRIRLLKSIYFVMSSTLVRRRIRTKLDALSINIIN